MMNERRILRTGVIAIVALAVSIPGHAAAVDHGMPQAIGPGDPVPVHREGERAIARLRSPYCLGFMLQNCTSGDAAVLRDSLNMMAAEGWAVDSLVDWMVGNHGEEYRAMPKMSGSGLLAWLAPPFFLVLGLSVVVIVLRRIRADAPATGPAVPLSSADEERLRVALRELESEDD